MDVDVDVVAMLRYAFTTLQIKFQFVVTMENIPFVKVLIKPVTNSTLTLKLKRTLAWNFLKSLEINSVNGTFYSIH